MKSVVSRRFVSLLVVLVAVSAAWGVEVFQNRALAKELAPIAAKHVQEFKTADTRVVSLVTVSREYVLLGEPLAKVAVFVEGKGDAKDGGAREIDYDYQRENGTWTMVDSGSCGCTECQLRARKEFEKSAQHQ